jgi:hypothetical protein
VGIYSVWRVIVWVSSFPRSGNTFLRIVLHRLYGIRASVVYDQDGVAERLGGELIGYEDRAAGYAELRASQEVHFIKTHRCRDDLVDEQDPAICLVRDGRDSLVSWARMASESDPSRFETELRTMIDRSSDTSGTGSWGHNVLSWLRPPEPHRVLLRYDDLARDPYASVDRALTALLPGLRPLTGATIPSFGELHQVDPGFFRRGRTGTHHDELPPALHDHFWSKPDNTEAMQLLGYPRDTRGLSSATSR